MKLSRRDLLHGAAIGALLPGIAQGQGDASLTPAAMPSGFSPAEYPRRWQRLRALMREQKLDCIISPDWSDDEPSDVMYLAGTGGAWVVFPYEGTVTVIGRRGDERGKNEVGVELRPDGRPPGSITGNPFGGRYSPALIAVLREKGMANARIGVGYLSGVPRNEEGVVSYATLSAVAKALPGATFVSAADVMIRQKLVRSEEELAVMQTANAVAELGAKTMLETARPGVSLLDLWFRMHETMIRASGAPGVVAFEASRQEGGVRARPRGALGGYSTPHGGPPAAGDVLRNGQILNQEITARAMGYNMQVNHAMCVGGPAPAGWDATIARTIDAFNTLLEFIRPGRTVRELNDLWVKLSAFEKHDTNVVFHFGDGPRMGPNRPEGSHLVVEEGWVFQTLKPQLPIPPLSGMEGRDKGMFARFGDGVVVTATGARRIGRRPFGATAPGA